MPVEPTPSPAGPSNPDGDLGEACGTSSPTVVASAGGIDLAALGISNQRESIVALGRRDGAADRALHHLAVPPLGARLRRAPRAPATPRRCRAGPAWRSTRCSRPPRSPGCSITCPAPAAGRARRTARRHGRQLAALEPDRRRGPRHRPFAMPRAPSFSTRGSCAGTRRWRASSTCRSSVLPEVRPSDARFGKVTADPRRCLRARRSTP